MAACGQRDEATTLNFEENLQAKPPAVLAREQRVQRMEAAYVQLRAKLRHNEFDVNEPTELLKVRQSVADLEQEFEEIHEYWEFLKAAEDLKDDAALAADRKRRVDALVAP